MDRFTDVIGRDGTEHEVRVVEGHVFVCKGCCCGNPEKGVPEVPLDAFKRQWKERGIRRRVHLSISGCLGPCAVANVVLVLLHGRSVWFHSIDTEAHVTAIYDYVERALGVGDFAPPDGDLSLHEFNRYTTDPRAEGEWACVGS